MSLDGIMKMGEYLWFHDAGWTILPFGTKPGVGFNRKYTRNPRLEREEHAKGTR